MSMGIGQTIGRGRFEMGMFAYVPPLDERVITPRASADKVRRVLAMMGCEFEDV